MRLFQTPPLLTLCLCCVLSRTHRLQCHQGPIRQLSMQRFVRSHAHVCPPGGRGGGTWTHTLTYLHRQTDRQAGRQALSLTPSPSLPPCANRSCPWTAGKQRQRCGQSATLQMLWTHPSMAHTCPTPKPTTTPSQQRAAATSAAAPPLPPLQQHQHQGQLQQTPPMRQVAGHLFLSRRKAMKTTTARIPRWLSSRSRMKTDRFVSFFVCVCVSVCLRCT